MIFIQQLPSLFEYHKSSKDLNLQAITIWLSKQRFVIVPNCNRSRIPTILQINRASKTIKQHSKLNQASYNSGDPHFFSCLLGIITLGNKNIILLAEQVNIVGCIGQRDVFRVTKSVYLFYDLQDKKSLTESEAEVLVDITTIFEQGMYFSFTYDLAQRMHSTYTEAERNQFNWARGLQEPLQNFNRMWRISVIQGFVGRLEVHLNGLKLFIILISRRAVKRGGTQWYSRGIDSEGNTGNYVETEQIMIVKDHYFSFLQIRGSAPLMWNQTKSNYGFVSVKCSGSQEQNYAAFKKHISLIQKNGNFNDIYLLNLLASNKEDKKLVQNYQFLVRKLGKMTNAKEELKCDVRYAYFDVHSQCPNKDYLKLNSFLEDKLKTALAACNFTAIIVNNTEKQLHSLHQQTGVFRTNCYNCIDRTNIAQSRMGALKLIQILNFLEIEIKQFKNGLAFFTYNTPFSTLYRNLWADNGDALSKQHTGTGSTQSFAVRKGKLSYLATLDHGMKSIFRVIRNIRNQDKKKQAAICYILGQSLNNIKSEQNQQSLEKPLQIVTQEQELQQNESYNYRKLNQTATRTNNGQ